MCWRQSYTIPHPQLLLILYWNWEQEMASASDAAVVCGHCLLSFPKVQLKWPEGDKVNSQCSVSHLPEIKNRLKFFLVGGAQLWLCWVKVSLTTKILKLWSSMSLAAVCSTAVSLACWNFNISWPVQSPTDAGLVFKHIKVDPFDWGPSGSATEELRWQFLINSQPVMDEMHPWKPQWAAVTGDESRGVNLLSLRSMHDCNAQRCSSHLCLCGLHFFHPCANKPLFLCGRREAEEEEKEHALFQDWQCVWVVECDNTKLFPPKLSY